MKKYVLLAWMLLGIISAVDAAEQFVKFDKASAENALLLTGSECASVLVATVGKSELAKKYPKQSKLLKGKWEQYLIFTDKGKLVILGSDKRGTIYGIYELSRQIGVSPWYFITQWWQVLVWQRFTIMPPWATVWV